MGAQFGVKIINKHTLNSHSYGERLKRLNVDSV